MKSKMKSDETIAKEFEKALSKKTLAEYRHWLNEQLDDCSLSAREAKRRNDVSCQRQIEERRQRYSLGYELLCDFMLD